MTRPKHLTIEQHRVPRRKDAAFMCFLVLVSLFCSLYLEATYEFAGSVRTGTSAGIFLGALTLGSVARTAVLFVCFMAGLYVISSFPLLMAFLEKWRYPIALGLLALLVIAQIHGSSIAIWGDYLHEPSFNGTLFGLPRTIRSDEWEVFTPFSFSQVATGNHAVSNVIRGGNTDVTMVYAQPSWSLATLYRPFLWGYLVLGAARGLSFFWCSRAILLVLVTYDFMLLVTNSNKRFAGYAAILVGFAPIVEWWFAVNGTADLFIFGQGLVLVLHHLLRSKTTRSRWLLSMLMWWLAGCYVLIIYPAWQVPFVYVFGALGIWDAWKWAHEEGTQIKSTLLHCALPLLVGMLLTCGAVGFCLYNAREALTLESNTAYPGSRFSTGGGLAALASQLSLSPLSALWPDQFPVNVCEASCFISLFPLGIVLSLFAFVKRRKADACLVLLLSVYVLLATYGLLGFPSLLARLSLLSNTYASRLLLPLGYLDIVLLVRARTLLDAMQQQPHDQARHVRRRELMAACVVALLMTAALVVCARNTVPSLMGIRQTVILAVAFLALLVPMLLPQGFFELAGRTRGTWLVVSATMVFAMGVCVNPTQHGASVLLESPALQTVAAHVAKEPEAVWLTDDSPAGQLCITVGARTVTSVNVYPDLTRWSAVDPEGTYVDSYNRYAHLTLALGKEKKFDLIQADLCAITLPPEDVPKLGATYWLSRNRLEEWNTDSVRFEPVEQAGPFMIYRIVFD